MTHPVLAARDHGIARALFNRRFGSHRLLILIILGALAASGALTGIIATNSMEFRIGRTNVEPEMDSFGKRAGDTQSNVRRRTNTADATPSIPMSTSRYCYRPLKNNPSVGETNQN